MAVTIQKIIGSSDGNPDNGLTARNKINANFQNLVDAILSIHVEAGTTSFENLTNKPSTLQGYGITDAASINHAHTFSSITNKPTTLLGYGILDAANINHTHEYIPLSQKGSINGVASLNDSGIIISSQLPSYVDDVIEVSTYSSLPVTGESGKIYVTIDDNLTYRWTGSIYVEISKSIALGETSSTAYRGDLGAIAYIHSQIAGGTGVHISNTERTNWNTAYTNNHTHVNKSLLDAFSQSDNDVLNHLSIVDGKLKVDIDLYSLGEVSAYGIGTSGGGGYGLIQSVYGYSDLGGTYSDTDLTNTFNAFTINSINNSLTSAISRISILEGGSSTSISTAGAGNAITSVTKSGSTLTFTKGSTFIVEGDSRLTNARYNPYAIIFTGYSSGVYDGSNAVTITIPNNTNQLTNGAGFITASGSITGNAGTATALQNSRTIWGQSFNGTANITGALSNVTDLTMSGTLNVGSAQLIYDSATNTLRVQKSDGTAIGFYSTGEVASYGIGSTGGNSYVTATKFIVSGDIVSKNSIYTGGKTSSTDGLPGTVFNKAGGLEICGPNPLIDFHYNSSTEDFTSRLIEFFSGQLSVSNKFRVGDMYTSNGSYAFYVTGKSYLNGDTTINGAINSTGTGTFTGGSFSSLRKLKNIHNDWKGDALDEICKLKIRNFNYKNNPLINKTLGLIVDEIPESISDYLLMGENKDSINLYTLHSLSLLGLQQTKTEVDLLKDKISELENRIKDLENN